ncbi:hypothetical protein BC628DRAFT_1045504 [Trametes gibbosa]|nr:hypothetical protein BC628DRAFT_1045504 [Trametes gibbosa]
MSPGRERPRRKQAGAGRKEKGKRAGTAPEGGEDAEKGRAERTRRREGRRGGGGGRRRARGESERERESERGRGERKRESMGQSETRTRSLSRFVTIATARAPSSARLGQTDARSPFAGPLRASHACSRSPMTLSVCIPPRLKASRPDLNQP